jgi:hypothetical protein
LIASVIFYIRQRDSLLEVVDKMKADYDSPLRTPQ